MKKLFKIFFVTCLMTGIINGAEAQRSRNNVGSGNRENSSFTRPAPQRNFERRTSQGSSVFSRPAPQSNPGNTRPTTPQRNFERRTPQGSSVFSRPAPQSNTGNIRPSTQQRNIVSSQSYRRPNSVSRDNDSRYSRDNYRNDDYRYSNYRTVYGRRTVFMYGPRYNVIPRSSISIYFGGNPYYYNDGYFYGYYGGYYQPLFPPFGIRVGFLPYGYSRFYIGPDPFYYYNGIYYRQYDDDSYEVVDAPMGASVSSLPKGAKSVVVNGEKLYELNGTYYKEDRDSKGNDVYTVVGKNGEINNTAEGDNGAVQGVDSAPLASLQVGDIVNQLPEGSKIVTINGEKMYATPDNTYLKEIVGDGGVVQYSVVGK
ncbi:MAG: DUF6515 family protein [Bacteroidota bacterium]|nr:DUF6515 family protein [Bacteroidota bacterium]